MKIIIKCCRNHQIAYDVAASVKCAGMLWLRRSGQITYLLPLVMHKGCMLGHREASQLLLLLKKLFIFVFKETISEHRKTFSPDCTRDLIDSFLEEMELRKKETDSTFNGKTNKMFYVNCTVHV